MLCGLVSGIFLQAYHGAITFATRIICQCWQLEKSMLYHKRAGPSGRLDKRSLDKMCMGCAGVAMINSDGKTPDTTESLLYLGAFMLWVVLLTHAHKKWGVDANNSQR